MFYVKETNCRIVQNDFSLGVESTNGSSWVSLTPFYLCPYCKNCFSSPPNAMPFTGLTEDQTGGQLIKYHAGEKLIV